MIYDLRFTIRICLLAICCQLSTINSARAQSDGYTMLSDSNGVALPGFYFPGTNVLGTVPIANLPTNLVTTAQLNSTSNNIVTNTAAQISNVASSALTASNNFIAFQIPINGNGNVLTSTTNSLNLGGSSNTISAGTPKTDSSINLGGQFNYINGTAYGTVIVGGLSNLMSGGLQDVILGGVQNWRDAGGGACALIGGFRNHVYGTGSVVLGGQNNLIGVGAGPQNDVYNTVLGGTNVQMGARYGIGGGRDVLVQHDNSFVFADYFGGTNFSTTAANQVLFRAYGGFGIGTNNPGTNQLAVAGNSDFNSVSVQGTNVMGQFNVLSVTFNYNLNIVSNACAGTNAYTVAALNINSNFVIAVSNYVVAVSNLVSLNTKNLTNAISGITQSKAFTVQLPATYASIGIGLNTPLMPDANYSVVLTPQDQATAEAPLNGIGIWIGSKTTSGFTIYASYATNAYNLNYDCILKENTQ